MIESKIYGRKNYVVRTYDKTAQCGYVGHFHKLSFVAFSSDGDHGLTWRYFTYKKDLLEALKQYKALRYEIEWK